MTLGSNDQKHDYPERGWQGSKPVSPAGRTGTAVSVTVIHV